MKLLAFLYHVIFEQAWYAAVVDSKGRFIGCIYITSHWFPFMVSNDITIPLRLVQARGFDKPVLVSVHSISYSEVNKIHGVNNTEPSPEAAL